MRSGKAAAIGSRGLRRLGQLKALLLKIGLEHIATLWARLSGEIGPEEEAGISMVLVEPEAMDPAEKRETAKLWIQAVASGMATKAQALAAWQRLGLIEEDQDLAEMVSELEEASEAAAVRAMEAFQRSRPEAAEEPEEDEDQDEAVTNGRP